MVNISDLGDYVGKYINVINENEVYDFIKIPKDDIDERVSILWKEYRKEEKIQILGNVKKKLKKIFDDCAHKFEELELPLPTSIEITYRREYDHNLFVDYYTLYDAEDRSIGSDECGGIKFNESNYSLTIDDLIRDMIHSVDTEALMEHTNWDGYRIIFGDLNNN